MSTLSRTVEHVSPMSPFGEVRVPKKPSEPEEHKPLPEPTGKRLSARLPGDLEVALLLYLDSQRPRPTDTGVLLTALEDFLRARGFWPLPVRRK